jgi:diguanylate cyclase (GGDEF)-like protein
MMTRALDRARLGAPVSGHSGHSITKGEARYDGRQFIGRVVIAGALAVAAALVPQAGPDRFIIAVVLGLIVVPTHFLIRSLAGVPNPTGPLEVLAVVAGSACALVEPVVWTPALLFQALAIAASISYQRSKWIAINVTVAMTTMSAVAHVRGIDGSLPPLIVFAVFVPVLVSGSRRMQAGERRASSRVRSAVEGLPIVVWEADPVSGLPLSMIGRLDHLDRTRSELVANGFAAFVHPHDRHLHWTENALRDTIGPPYRFLRPDGEAVWLRDHVSEDVTERGRIVRGVSLDVTATRAQEIDLMRQREIVERMAATTLVLETVPDDQHRIVHAVDPIHLGVEHAAGRTFSEVFPDLAADAQVAAALRGSTGVERVGPLQLLDATERFVELEVFPISDGATAVLISDVTDRELAARTIRRQAHFDDLTGLPNRVTFMQLLEQRTDAGDPTAMLLIDLNRFKEVNDTLGHLSGDEFLRALGARLGALADRRGCTVARLGGDEFAFVTAFDDGQEVAALAQAVLDVCREPVEILGSAVASGASIGVAVTPIDADTPESLLRCADLAMYRAKSSRRGVWWYEPSLDRGTDDVETLGRLGAALRNGEFEMHFQPIIDLGDRQVVGAEALARWRHPVRGLLGPEAFLDLLGVAGLSGALTSIAIDQSVAAASRVAGRFTVSINLSAHDLRNTELASEFRSALHRHRVPARQLLVEITEEHLLDPTGVVATTLHELSNLGLRIAVDDFGTGYSSLTHLRSLPLGHLKIDREFVSGVIDEEHDAVIVRAVTDLAHNLGLSVTAEGVESPDVADELARLGCNFAQGYLWGRPMPLDELLASGTVEVRTFAV